MEEEIDLRRYVEVLIRYWKWIAGMALIASLTALVVSFLLAPTYEASAVVMITQPRYRMEFDPRFETVDQWTPAYKAFPTLATSDGVLEQVLASYTPGPQSCIETWRLKALSGMVEATSEGDPSLVLLKVSACSPEDAAGIANVWTDVLVEQGNEIYGESESDVAFFRTQAGQAEQALRDAEEALIAFEAQNEASIVNAQLDSVRRSQSDYLTDQRTITYLVQDIRGLRAQLAQQPADRPASLADDLTTLFLQVKAFNAQASTPIQLQVNSAESLSNKSLAEQIAFLDGLVETLEAKHGQIEERLAELEPEILTLQEELQQIQTEKHRLQRVRNLADETYVTLSRKLEEARISAQEENGALQVGSYAAAPEEPASPRKKLNTVIAGMLGLMMGVFGVFALDWWREDEGDR